jgi:hypothetical protein
MKSFLYSSITLMVILLLAKSLNAQYSLQTAKYAPFKLNNLGTPPYVFNHDSLCPVTSTLPVGPYYGNMNLNQRPMWYYFPSCISALSVEVSYGSQYFIPFTNITSFCVAVWGPFDDISSLTLSQLDSSKLIGSYCGYSNSNNFRNVLLPSIDTGKVYIFVATTDDTTSVQFAGMCLNLIPRFPVGLIAYASTCYLCNGRASYFEQYHGVCALNVDTPGNYPHLIWNKNIADIGFAGYYVTRVNALSSLDTIAYLPYFNTLSEYIDTTVNAVQQKWTYGIIPVDSCGQANNDNASIGHATIFLQTSAGLNNQVNLNWDFKNLEYNSVTPTFYIWRASNGNPALLIDSMSFNWGMPQVSYYTDINVPTGQVIYSIEVRNQNACNAMKMPVSYVSSFSNISGAMVLGIDEMNELSSIKVSPNPVTDNEIFIDFGNMLHSDVIITLYTLEGKKTGQVTVNKGSDQYQWRHSNISPGIYQLSIESGTYTRNIKLVVF